MTPMLQWVRKATRPITILGILAYTIIACVLAEGIWIINIFNFLTVIYKPEKRIHNCSGFFWHTAHFDNFGATSVAKNIKGTTIHGQFFVLVAVHLVAIIRWIIRYRISSPNCIFSSPVVILWIDSFKRFWNLRTTQTVSFTIHISCHHFATICRAHLYKNILF